MGAAENEAISIMKSFTFCLFGSESQLGRQEIPVRDLCARESHAGYYIRK